MNSPQHTLGGLTHAHGHPTRLIHPVRRFYWYLGRHWLIDVGYRRWRRRPSRRFVNIFFPPLAHGFRPIFSSARAQTTSTHIHAYTFSFYTGVILRRGFIISNAFLNDAERCAREISGRRTTGRRAQSRCATFAPYLRVPTTHEAPGGGYILSLLISPSRTPPPPDSA